jgi:ribosomal protein S18 acetylase RimI-like enzyme
MLPSATVFAARVEGSLTGVAAWRPPHPVEPDEAARARAHRAHSVVRKMFPLSNAALFNGFEALERLHPEVSHWYLGFVGIEPACQGRGFGSHLLRPALNVADETGIICHLETPFRRTHAFYEALGFRRHAEHHTFVGAGHGVVTFLRPAETRQTRAPA